MYKERIKVIIRHADPYDKTGDATKGGRVAKYDFAKIFRNQVFIYFFCYLLFIQKNICTVYVT